MRGRCGVFLCVQYGHDCVPRPPHAHDAMLARSLALIVAKLSRHPEYRAPPWILCTHIWTPSLVCPDHAHLILMSLDLNEPPPPEGMDGGWWMVIHHGQAPQWRLTLSDGVRAHFHLHMRYAHAIRHKQDCLLAISKQVQGTRTNSLLDTCCVELS